MNHKIKKRGKQARARVSIPDDGIKRCRGSEVAWPEEREESELA